MMLPCPKLVLPTDSLEYEILWSAALTSLPIPGASCEIGVRLGGSSELILRASMMMQRRRPHIAIDPWGHIPFLENERYVQHDYGDKMRRKCLADLYAFAYQAEQDLVLLPFMDTDVFAAFQHGIPFYTEKAKGRINQYSLVHFDGPHGLPVIQNEIAYFGPRTPVGGWWVFDDVSQYPHARLDPIIEAYGFVRRDTPLVVGRPNPRKASYERVQ